MSSDSEQFSSAQPQPVRDQLAIDRTILANERTMLAYVRTALTLLIVSVAFIKFVESLFIVTLGVAFIPLSIAIAFIGLRRYRRRRATITRLYGQTPLTAPGIAEPSSDGDSSPDDSDHDSTRGDV